MFVCLLLFDVPLEILLMSIPANYKKKIKSNNSSIIFSLLFKNISELSLTILIPFVGDSFAGTCYYCYTRMSLTTFDKGNYSYGFGNCAVWANRG